MAGVAVIDPPLTIGGGLTIVAGGPFNLSRPVIEIATVKAAGQRARGLRGAKDGWSFSGLGREAPPRAPADDDNF